jgi:cyclic dehypoxanthinyl futalosine synthase
LARLIVRHLCGGREPRLCSRPAREIVETVAGKSVGLLIGDAALEVQGRFAYQLDLGQAWKDMTGLPFVFAVWGARPGTLSAADAGLIQASLRAGVEARPAIAQAWMHGHGGDADKHLAYLTDNIRYDLDEAAQAGLHEFLRRAAEAGLIPESQLRLIGQAELPVRPQRRSVDALLEYAADGGRLSVQDALWLGEEADTHELGLAADLRRKALHPEEVVTYIVDRNVNYTNVCTTSCRFCAFYRPVGHAEGYVLSRDELGQKIEETVAAGGIQILLQGGLNPALQLEWYEDLFRWIKATYPIQLHALSPEEIWHLVRIEDLSVQTVLTRLRKAGLDSVPGGGAEVLTDRVRSKIAKAKCTSAEWIEVMRVAHRLGMRTTATMMFGTSDTLEDRVLHMLKIRELQDETGGFTAFICWDYQHDVGTRAVAGETGTVLYLRTQALSRLVIDNVQNIQTSWVTQGPGIGQVGLRYGANDMGSTMFEENVVSSAGTTFGMDAAQIERHVRALGFKVARRNMRYELLSEPQ